jgi:hypothetical protein
MQLRPKVPRGALLVSYGVLLLDQAANWTPWVRPIRGLALQPLATVLFLVCLLVFALGKLRQRPVHTEEAEARPLALGTA